MRFLKGLTGPQWNSKSAVLEALHQAIDVRETGARIRAELKKMLYFQSFYHTDHLIVYKLNLEIAAPGAKGFLEFTLTLSGHTGAHLRFEKITIIY